MLTFRDFVTGLRKLEIDPVRPVIAHASLSAFGEVHGGAETVLGALSSSFNTLIMPAFTYKTMITPEVGPPDNAISYGSGRYTNRMAEIYRADMPADKMMGVVAECCVLIPRLSALHTRSCPLLGINAKPILDSQSIKELHSARFKNYWNGMAGCCSWVWIRRSIRAFITRNSLRGAISSSAGH